VPSFANCFTRTDTYNQGALNENVFVGLRLLVAAPRVRLVPEIMRKPVEMPKVLPRTKAGTAPAHRPSSLPKRSGHLRPAATVALFAMLLGTSLHGLASNTAARKQKARDQFDRAEQMRESLNGLPEQQRSSRDYQHVIDAYRKVYYVAPTSSKADASVVAVAELLAEMGRQFPPGDKNFNAAIREYEFLRREYPGSKYRFQALFTIGQIYKIDLGDVEAARKTFDEFLAHYPRNLLAPEARKAMAELDRLEPARKQVEEPAKQPDAALAAENSVQSTAKKKAGLSLVTGIRHWSTPDYTRVAIDVDREVKYEAGRVSSPDRIFFDLPDTKLASVLVGKSFDVQDGFLKKIRVAQYQPGSTRVVLEVADVSTYSAFLLPNPYRLIIDIHGRGPQTQVAKAKPPARDEEDALVPAGSAKNTSSATTSKLTVAPGPASAGGSQKKAGSTVRKTATNSDDDLSATTAAEASSPTSASSAPPRKVVVDEEQNVAPAPNPSASLKSTAPPGKSSAKSSPGMARATSAEDALLSSPADIRSPEMKATTQPTSAPTAVAVEPRSKPAKKNSKTTALAESPAVHEAAPTSGGERSLTRALGLKIGRIVVDAGHGGHDTGTIGPNGLMEKDLVLDVALRLGRLLETRLGADVIYTRDDDTFIPLETRTAIANEHQADLFISIHANSSPDPNARGIETYYLNFASSPDALEVAARENAVSEKSIYELQDLVKKITMKEKIEESRELAADVQQSLYSGLASRRSTLRDRGVKKAPFVVLIGANMPSILAEISFVSNPTDAAKLETPEYREKIAESLYRGIARYAGGLSGVKVASKISKAAGE
jgi:N-acetylmuramoyl-L-alanine amidase